MHILCLGINHTSALVHLRERIAFSDEQIRSSLARLSCGLSRKAGVEMVILSTCNRIEIYAASTRLSFVELEAFLSEARGVALHELHPHLYHLADAKAVHHLLEVAAGLDSLVLGEPQILGQVTRALELARRSGAAGPLLTRFFQAAVHAGKRIRTETTISRNPASVPSLAAGLCGRFVPDLPDAQVLILGAGEMAGLAVEALRKRGVQRLLVINRTRRHARLLADRWHANSETFENLGTALARTDILVSSTAASQALIHAPMVVAAMRQRPERPLLLIDIAVPRNIDPGVAQVPNVHLVDIDHLNAQLEHSLALRTAQVPQVQAILAEEETKFLAFLGALEMLPLITDLYQQAEAIRRAELEKTLRGLPDLTEAERIHIEAMTRALVSKLLANPANHLRTEALSPHAPEIARLARTLFDLESASAPHQSQGDKSPAFAAFPVPLHPTAAE